jgi:multidrug transporter EmrE-like cation transporter
MTEARLALLAVVAPGALTAVADVLVKKSAEIGRLDSVHMILATVMLGSAYGWCFALKHMNLATLSGAYSLIAIFLLVLAGIVLFGERLRFADCFVSFMSLVALAVFWRHV